MEVTKAYPSLIMLEEFEQVNIEEMSNMFGPMSSATYSLDLSWLVMVLWEIACNWVQEVVYASL